MIPKILQASGEIARTQARQNILSGVDTRGAPFRVTRNPTPLIDTGVMKESWGIAVTRRSLTVFNTQFYSGQHNEGIGQIRRTFLEISDPWLTELAQRVLDSREFADALGD